MRVAPRVELTEDQKKTLQQWARGRSLPARQVERARVILLAAAGKQDLEIAAEIGISNQKAARWRKRFLKMGLAGLEKDAPRPGRTPTITAAKVQEVVRRTTQEKPSNATQWSTRPQPGRWGSGNPCLRDFQGTLGAVGNPACQICKVGKYRELILLLGQLVEEPIQPRSHELLKSGD